LTLGRPQEDMQRTLGRIASMPATGHERFSACRFQFAANLTFIGATVHSRKVIIWMGRLGDKEVSA
jgi:hypothetical protein